MSNVNRTVHLQTVSNVSRPRSTIDPKAVAAAFAPDGLHGVSASEVAARAGVAKPTLYAHGRSKEAVFLACVEAEVERLLDRLSAADLSTREQGVAARASAIVLALIDHARAHPHAFRLLNVTGRHRDSGVAAATDGALDRVPMWIAAALRRDVPRTHGGEDPARTL
ncbi:MAG: TetR family transcriptional regulator, partial [Solirubrobacterales bacterium]|nr:TetR family transcriptional regulator [Solirubrobacterales bacterium]